MELLVWRCARTVHGRVALGWWMALTAVIPRCKDDSMARQGAKRPKRLPLDVYEAELGRLQAELVTLQEWVRARGQRVVVLFEGRDAAGKGSAIKRITQYLNPRAARIAALPAPTDRERGEWY